MLKLPGLCLGFRWGAHSAPTGPLAGFRPILCLVVFFISPNCMQYIVIPSILTEDLHLSDKNDLTAWVPIRLGSPVSTFVPPEKFSLWGPAYCSRIKRSCKTPTTVFRYQQTQQKKRSTMAAPVSSVVSKTNGLSIALSFTTLNVTGVTLP